MVTTAHQNASGMDLKKEFSEPASAKYTALENSTTPVEIQQQSCRTQQEKKEAGVGRALRREGGGGPGGKARQTERRAERTAKGKGRRFYLMSPYPTVVMVTTAHQKASGMDLKKDISEPASAKYTALENRMTPETGSLMGAGQEGVQLGAAPAEVGPGRGGAGGDGKGRPPGPSGAKG